MLRRSKTARIGAREAARSVTLLLMAALLMVGLSLLPETSVRAVAVADTWPTYMHDAQRTGASADTALSTTSVAQLGLAWKTATGGMIATSPTIADGMVFAGSWDGYEYALNAATGAVLWKTFLGTTSAPTCNPPAAGVTSAPAVQGGVVYLGGGDSYWYALDENTGAVLWKVFTGDNSATGGHYNWSSPLIANGYAYIGVASVGDCPLVQGQLLQVSLTTHLVTNTLNIVPNGQVGGGIWTSPSLDPVTNTVYVTTGTLADPSQTMSQALLAVDGTTLAVKSVWQLPAAENVADSDWGTSPILFADAGGRQLVAAINKNGTVYAFDRTNVAAGPVWRRWIAYGGECPTCGDGSVSNLAFASGRLFAAGGTTTIAGRGYQGSVRALDPATGNILWEHGDAAPVLPALAYDNGFVIAGTGATLELLDAGTGARLYSYTTGALLYGPPAIANGTIYLGSLDHNVYALALPATPPPPPPADAQCPTGWTCQDIGAPSPAGSETTSGTAWTIVAGGAGVGGTSDAFRFISEGVSGDGQITLHASALAASSAGAAVGLMLRQSADPSAPFFTVLLQPGNQATVAYRARFGGATTTLNTVTTAGLPLWLLLQRVGDQLSAATSPDGANYTLIPGTTATVVLPTASLAGVAATSGLSGTAGSATVDTVTPGAVSITPSPAPSASPCPAGWSCADVGNPLMAGDQTLATTGAWTISGAGNDINYYADQFHFVWQSFAADATISARVTAQSNTSANAKAGIMLRQSTDASAAFYAVFETPGQGIVVMARPGQGLRARALVTQTAALPAYLRIARSTNTYSTYTSSDGVNWTYLIGTSVSLSTSGAVLGGLAITSNASGTVGSASLDTVTLASSAPPPPVACPTGWSCADVGASLPAGNEALNAGTWTIQAGGTDIWGTADQFHFDWQTLLGDGTISAHVTSQTNTSTWAKAGVMLRLSSDANAPYFLVAVTPTNGIVVQYRTAAGASAQQSALVAGATPAYLRVGRAGTTFTGYTSTDGVTWAAIAGSSVTIAALSGSLLAGLAVTSHAQFALSTVTIDSVAIVAAPAAVCPSGWTCGDIGAPTPAGSESLTNGVWTVQGAGNDIWGTADQFHYDWQSQASDGTLSAHVTAQTNTSTWAKAGVMLRLSTDPGAPFYLVAVTPANGIAVQYRATAAASAQQAALLAGTVPAYLRIGRAGSTFTAYTSADGVNWTLVSNSGVTIPALTGTLLAGLAVTSHNAGTLGSATFDSVALSTAAPPSTCPTGWTCADIGAPAVSGGESVNNGVWNVQGAGNDIWGTADQFRYEWQALAGDGTLSAHITAQTNTSTWAKAGVMLRLSSDPGAPFYAVEMTPGNGIVVQYRATAAANAQQAAGIAGLVPLYLRIGRSGTTFTGYTSTDGVTWTAIAGSTVTVAALTGSLLAGLAVTSHNGGALSNATFDTVALAAAPAPPPSTCPTGYSCADIGAPALAGTQQLSGGTWTVQGAGGDIWGTADQFHYVWHPLMGDGTQSAHVTTQTNTSTWAKAGVMLRLSTDPGSPFYAVEVTPGNGITVQYRATAGANAIQAVNLAGTTPTYLRVARVGTSFVAYTSADGVTWTPITGSAVTLPSLSGSLLAGLAVTSHNTAALCIATFDSVGP